jgi:amino acid adenylation domain-containing protein/non-ribosomal peptide synthase protein (TIGR01720 family)
MTAIEGFRLSAQQRRIWRLQAGSTAPHMVWCVARVRRPVDVGQIRDALGKSVARHEILRTVFRSPAGLDVPLQVILDGREAVALEVHDLRAAAPEKQASRYAALRAAVRTWPVDLAHGPVLSAAFVRFADEPADARLLLRLPALCADRTALHILLGELATHLGGGELTGEPLQYADFAQWQEDLLTAEEFELERDYWLERDPAGLAPALPFVAKGEHGPGHALTSVPVDLPPGLPALAERLDVEVSTIALAAWHLLLRTLAGTAELAVGVRHANRRAAELREALGSYEKYLPSVAPVGPDPATFAGLVRRLHAELDAMAEVQEYFGWDMWAGSAGGPRLLAAGFDWRDAGPEHAVLLEEMEAHTDHFPVRLSGLEVAGAPHLDLWYDTGSVDPADTTVLIGQYAAVLRAAVAHPDAPLADLVMAEPDPPTALPRPSTVAVHQRFAEHVRRTPERVAARSPGGVLTLAELDERANQLAHHLRELGAGTDRVVGLCLDRSLDLIVGLLGILKAGAAYLPLDPALPPARRRAMLDQAAARLVVTIAGYADETTPERTTVCLDTDRAVLDRRRRDAPAGSPAGDQLAYVVFTSGSTGTPKGVGVTHANLAGYLDGIISRLGLGDAAHYALLSTVAADLGNTTLFAALATGGTLHVLPPDHTTDPALLSDYLRRHPVDCMKITPSHLRALLDAPHPETVLPARCLVLGGEAASWDLVRTVASLVPECRVLNHYGPAETTVGVLTHDVTPEPGRTGTVPLGRPLLHVHVHVLDERLRPAPTWVAGEIYVGGATIARGYLARPGHTAERFVPDPFSATPGARLYRTGDRARRLADGRLVFLGRRDHQVKLRGFRVELGEIEAVLRGHAAVRDAVAAVDESAGTARLAAYVVADPSTTTGQLHDHCTRHLPDYMVPAVITVLDAMPLTANGKVDRCGLPAPRSGADTPYEPPGSPAEETLAAIWSQVLGVPRVGRHDDFFALGGDSILSIQVVARAARADLVLTPKLMFRHPTVAQLAAMATRTGRVAAEQGAVTGPVPPTPVQRWFLEQDIPAPHHYNQEILLRVRQPMERRALEVALAALVSHHDALRLRLRDGELDNAGPLDPARRLLTVADLSDLPADLRAAEFGKLAAATQAGIDLAAGCLLHALYARLGDDGDRLLLVVQHLGVDGVSWRILLEDLATAYTRATLDQPIALPPKTTAFRDWARRLADHAADRTAELRHWTGVLAGAEIGIPHDGDPADNTYGAADTVTVALTPESTQALLRPSGAASAHDVLLAALGHTLADWTGQRRVVVDIEGHGRDSEWDDVDLSRTVGWFTAIHPVALDVAGDHHTTLRAVREHLAAVPGGGLGYGILRHSGSGARLRALPGPEVRFNYHGQVVGGAENALFSSADENAGPSADPRGRRPYLLDITAVVAEGRLQVTWIFCPALHPRATIEALAFALVDHLHAVLDDPAAAGPMPADFPLAGLDQAQLDAITGMLGGD